MLCNDGYERFDTKICVMSTNQTLTRHHIASNPQILIQFQSLKLFFEILQLVAKKFVFKRTRLLISRFQQSFKEIIKAV